MAGARCAVLICAAFDEMRQHLNSVGPVRVTGNPVRDGFRPRTKPRPCADLNIGCWCLAAAAGQGRSTNKFRRR